MSSLTDWVAVTISPRWNITWTSEAGLALILSAKSDSDAPRGSRSDVAVAARDLHAADRRARTCCRTRPCAASCSCVPRAEAAAAPAERTGRAGTATTATAATGTATRAAAVRTAAAAGTATGTAGTAGTAAGTAAEATAATGTAAGRAAARTGTARTRAGTAAGPAGRRGRRDRRDGPASCRGWAAAASCRGWGAGRRDAGRVAGAAGLARRGRARGGRAAADAEGVVADARAGPRTGRGAGRAGAAGADCAAAATGAAGAAGATGPGAAAAGAGPRARPGRRGSPRPGLGTGSTGSTAPAARPAAAGASAAGAAAFLAGALLRRGAGCGVRERLAQLAGDRGLDGGRGGLDVLTHLGELLDRFLAGESRALWRERIRGSCLARVSFGRDRAAARAVPSRRWTCSSLALHRVPISSSSPAGFRWWCDRRSRLRATYSTTGAGSTRPGTRSARAKARRRCASSTHADRDATMHLGPGCADADRARRRQAPELVAGTVPRRIRCHDDAEQLGGRCPLPAPDARSDRARWLHSARSSGVGCRRRRDGHARVYSPGRAGRVARRGRAGRGRSRVGPSASASLWMSMR